jgi:hypothetical protein
MTTDHNPDIALLRSEIAVAAARMIAEDGASYDTAKRKAARRIMGNTRINGEILPDNAEIENEVRIYNEIFLSNSQPARLLQLRKLALRLMDELDQFNPYLTGSVLNGTAGEHSNIHLHLFADSAKDVEIFLLNRNIEYDVSESPRARGRNQPIETISFIWNNEGVHLTVYGSDDVRGALKPGSGGHPERANAALLLQLIEQSILPEG